MKRSYILLAFLASLFLGCGSYGEVNRFFGEECGNDYYDIEKQFCIDGKIYDKCNGSYYDPLSQKCENNSLFSSCGNDYYDIEKQFCREGKVYDKCNGSIYDPLNQKCENNVLFAKCGNDSYDMAKQFCKEGKVYDKCKGNSYDPLNQKCENDSLLSKCGDGWYNPAYEFCASGNVIENKGEFLDSRDGVVYKYVVIGTQVWMAENLRYEISGTKCYGDNLDNCKIYGMLYDWNTAKTVCPSGWHLPNDTEWSALRNSVGSDADSKLMASNVELESGVGTDDFGFTALPGGYYKGYYLTIGQQAIFWSATAGTAYGSAHSQHICPWTWVKEIEGLYIDEAWVNVRCLKD